MKRIVWDWNGTLFDDLDLCFQCINRLLENHNVDQLVDYAAYRNVFGFPIIDYYKRAGFDFSKCSFDILADEYMKDYQEKSMECSLQKDALEALNFVLEQNMRQDILSASKYDYLLDQIERFPISSYMDSIWGIQDIYAKSKVDIAKELKSKYPQDELWFIGDSMHDFEVAHAVCANSVLVTTGHQSKERLEKTGCKVVNSLMEAVEYIYEAD